VPDGIEIDFSAAGRLACRSASSIVPVIPRLLRYKNTRNRAFDVNLQPYRSQERPRNRDLPVVEHSPQILGKFCQHSDSSAQFRRRIGAQSDIGS
jgi:hypothetical protein